MEVSSCLQKHPVKSTYSKLRLLCRSLAGNNVYYLTVTAPSLQDECKVVENTKYLDIRLNQFDRTRGALWWITSLTVVAVTSLSD